MKRGKIPQSVLNRSVQKQLYEKPQADSGQKEKGGDYCRLQGENPCLAAAGHDIYMPEQYGRRSVIAAVNNFAASGLAPGALICHVTLPTTENEATLRELMREIDGTCGEIREKSGCGPIPVAGGHTDVCRQVSAPLCSVTAVGGGKSPMTGIRPGQTLLMAGFAGMEGTGLLSLHCRENLEKRFSAPFLDKAADLLEEICILPQALIAAENGAKALHDVGEGGIFGALWEFAEQGGVGLEIDLKSIPIRQETVEICEFYDINPYKLLGRGGLLIAAEDGDGVRLALEREGFPARIIGRTTDGNDRLLLSGEDRRFLETVQTDEIYRIPQENTGSGIEQRKAEHERENPDIY